MIEEAKIVVNETVVRAMVGNIVDQEVDAIVNAANSSLYGGGGVDGAIHRAGGPSILEECKAIRRSSYPDGLPTGQAVLTDAGDLPSRYVIHTVGPVWSGGKSGESQMLAACYRSSLGVAVEKSIRSVAFPAISTGAYRYPRGEAADVAIDSTIAYVEARRNAFDEIRFVLFSENDLSIYRTIMES